MAAKRDWGRIRQRPSGRWQARYPGPDGTLRPAPTTFDRKRDASDWLAEKQWRKTLQDAGVGAPTLAKAYRMVHSMFTTAVDDLLIRRNPCRIKGAGQDKADERPTLTIDQVFAVADTIPPRYRLLVLLGAFTGPRFGELAALCRRDIDLNSREVRVHRSQAELKHGRTIIKEPKSDAGKRRVAIPDVVIDDLRDHLDRFSEAGPDGLALIGPNSGRLRRRNFHRLWTTALADAKLDEAGFGGFNRSWRHNASQSTLRRPRLAFSS